MYLVVKQNSYWSYMKPPFSLRIRISQIAGAGKLWPDACLFKFFFLNFIYLNKYLFIYLLAHSTVY